MTAMLIRRIQRARAFVLAGCVVLLASPSVALAQIEVDQLEVFVSSAGRDRTASFRVRNASAEPLTARLSLVDWMRGPDGVNVFTDAGTVAGACAGRVTLFPELASLAPGEEQVVRVSYVGDSVTTMCWAAVMVGLAPRPAAAAGGAAIAAEVRHAVKVYVAPVATTLRVLVEELDVGAHRPAPGEAPDDTTGMDVVARFRNAGNAQVRAKVRIEYRSTADAVVARGEDRDVPMLPGAERVWRSRIPALPAGRYIVLVVVDFGGAELVAGQLELELAP